ncbi:MAG: type VI secretion system baseplate subunit TssF [Myxococcaceae bacterium]
MFSKYYQVELGFLRESGKAFGLAHPQLAGLLAERGGDPDVERLLEGFAFLSARIRERIEDAVPEVVHGLADILLPLSLRPIPACTIAELTPHLRALRSPIPVPAGTEFCATPVDGTSCRFRSSTPIELLPLSLTGVQAEVGQGTATSLRLSFQTTEQGRAAITQASGIRLFLHGELSTTTQLFLGFTQHLREVSLQIPGDSVPERHLPKESLVPVGLEKDAPLFPVPADALSSHLRLLEYFVFPQRFLFFELRNLFKTVPLSTDRFEVVFRFEGAPPLPGRLPADALRLHCVPIVNLFPATADPLRQEHPGQAMFLRAAGVDPKHMEVYSVEHVEGLREGGQRRLYPPFRDFAHIGNEHHAAFFQLHRAASPLDAHSDVVLRVGNPKLSDVHIENEVLSVELSATNRALASRVGLGDVRVPTSSSPTLAQFRNITPVTSPIPPALGNELHWQLISHLGMNQRSLAHLPTLRTLLGLYNFNVRADQNVARANTLRIQALRAVQTAPARRFVSGAPVRGMKMQLSVDETRFSGLGDAYLFGCMLDALFASAATLNSFHELSFKLEPSQAHYAWPPRSGSRPLL